MDFPFFHLANTQLFCFAPPSAGSKAYPSDGMGRPQTSNKFDLVLVVGTNVYYGKHLELGTRKMAARPFIRPSFNRNKQTIKSILGGEVGVSVGVTGGEDITPGRSGGYSF